MRKILFRTNPHEEWRVYTEIVSTLADAKDAVRFLQSLGTGYEFRLEEKECKA